MPKKVLAKKAVAKEARSCECCGCCCGGVNRAESLMCVIFGGLVVALSFFLLRTML